MMTGKNGVLGVLACTTVCAGTQVMAEESSAPVSVEEIVVTAQKRSERLQDVPVSVTAVEAAGLTERNALQLQDYLNDVPNVSAGDLGNGRTSVVIRGISTGFGNNPTTGFTIDDVPFGSSTSSGLGDVLVPNLDPADLQRVEVLRGPQGTLYGASSMGGLVKYVTVDPRTDDVGGQVEVDGSTVAHGGAGYGTRGSVDVPVLKYTIGRFAEELAYSEYARPLAFSFMSVVAQLVEAVGKTHASSVMPVVRLSEALLGTVTELSPLKTSAPPNRP